MYRAKKVSRLPHPDTTSAVNLVHRMALLSSAGSTLGTTKSLAQFAFLFSNASKSFSCLYHNTNSPSMAFQTSNGTRPTPLLRCTQTTLHMPGRRSASGGTMSRSIPFHTSPPGAARALVCSCSWLIASPALVSLLPSSAHLIHILPRKSARSSCH